MADSVINVVIAAKDEASKAFLAAARGADHLDAEQAAATKSAGDLDRQAADTAAALDRQARSAEAAAAAAAKLAAEQDKASTPARGADGRFLPRGSATPDAGSAPGAAPLPLPIPNPDPGGRAAGSVSNLSGRVMTLRYNLMDLAQQLAGGGSPFMALIQQGPEILMALGSASEAVTVLRAALGGLATAATAAASVLATIAVVAAAAAAAYVVLQNHADSAATSTKGLTDQVEASRAALDRARSSASAQGAALRELSKGAQVATEDLAVLVGVADKHEIAMKREIAAMEAANREKAIEATRNLAAAQTALTAEKALFAQGFATLTARGESRRRIIALEREIEVQGELAASANESIAIQRQAIELSADYRREEEAANKVLSERAQREHAAARAAQDRAKAEREASEAARQWAREQGMVNAAAQELAALAPELESLPDLIFNATWDGFASGLSESLTTLQKEMTGLAELFGKMLAEQIRKAARVGAAIGDVLGGNISAVLARALPALGAKLAEAFAGNDGLLGKIASIAGPAGAAIGAAVQGVQALGESGPKATSNQIVGGLQSIIKGITNIPALLVKLIPDLLTKVLPDLIVALVGVIPRLAVALVIELPVAIVRGIVLWWRDIGGFKGIARSIAEGVRDWWRDTWDRVKAWFKDIFTPGDQSRNRGRRGSAEERAAGQRAATNAALGLRDPTDQRVGLLASRRGGSRPAAGALVIQAASIHPDIVPRSARDMDRLYGAGGLRRGTIPWGAT